MCHGCHGHPTVGRTPLLDDHPHTRVGQWICESFGSAIRVVMTFPLEVSFVKLAIDLENQLFVDNFVNGKPWLFHSFLYLFPRVTISPTLVVSSFFSKMSLRLHRRLAKDCLPLPPTPTNMALPRFCWMVPGVMVANGVAPSWRKATPKLSFQRRYEKMMIKIEEKSCSNKLMSTQVSKFEKLKNLRIFGGLIGGAPCLGKLYSSSGGEEHQVPLDVFTPKKISFRNHHPIFRDGTGNKTLKTSHQKHKTNTSKERMFTAAGQT